MTYYARPPHMLIQSAYMFLMYILCSIFPNFMYIYDTLFDNHCEKFHRYYEWAEYPVGRVSGTGYFAGCGTGKPAVCLVPGKVKMGKRK